MDNLALMKLYNFILNKTSSCVVSSPDENGTVVRSAKDSVGGVEYIFAYHIPFSDGFSVHCFEGSKSVFSIKREKNEKYSLEGKIPQGLLEM